MGTILWGTQTAVSRIWAFETLPTRPPSGASKWDYYHIVPEDKTYIRLNNQWVLSHLQVGKGDKGDAGTNGTNGTNATINIGNVSTTTLGPTNAAQVAVIDTDPSESNANLNFSFAIPRGSDGKDGLAATVNVGTVSSLPPGSQPVVTNSGTNSAAVLNFGIPQGQPGQNGTNGNNGQAATIQVGTTTTLPAGSNATVTNVGTSSAAVFNFGIPRGADGAPGSGTGTITTIGKTRFVSNETDLRNAVAAHASGACNKIFVCDNIVLTQPLNLPKTTTSLSKQLHIDLNGNVLSDGSSAGLPYLIGRKPLDQSEALNQMQSWAFILENGALRGKTGTGTLVDLGSTFNSVCRNLKLENATVGIWFKFCLMGRIEHCISNSISAESFFIDRGDWSGATNFNSQSNHTKIESCRVFNRGGNFAAYRVQGCSGVEIVNSISEGGDPQWHIHFNSQASTVVKDFKLRGIHVESKSTSGGVYCRVSGGIMDIDGVFSQYDNNLFVAESAGGYCEMKISNIPWLTSGTKYQAIGSTRWTFTDVYDGANTFNATTRWVGGTLPTAGVCTYWNGNSRTTIVK